MRILLYIGILALLLLAPVERLDIASLEPVQTVAVSVRDGWVYLQTDTQNAGRGKTLAEAVEDLEENTPGVIYLDTAQYLLITQAALPCAKELSAYLRPAVKVSEWDGQGSVEKAAKFLKVRKKLPALRSYLEDDKKVEKTEKSS